MRLVYWEIAEQEAMTVSPCTKGLPVIFCRARIIRHSTIIGNDLGNGKDWNHRPEDKLSAGLCH